ncbi:hypothetical protein [Spirosoma pollinicola]|uniref:Uncharacterized protein n=1 Tax=Spirosoma pollinicola TaxID=2057025 RepID=A0A2K8ZAL4_9BACT|nr:hypothetical protein [Spirosoma pollinicola]AUD06859.1 hypothetical protein CWM47_36430 [Spirosoma pollinicola]
MADVLLGPTLPKTTNPVQPRQVSAYKSIPGVLGIHLDSNDFGFQFVLQDISLYLIRFDRNDLRLVRESANRFHQLNDPSLKLEFTGNPVGHLQVTAYHPTHPSYTLVRRNQDWSGFAFKRIKGTY